jgi:putative transposase
VRSLGVVVLAPGFDDGSRFGEAVEDLAIEQLVAELRVEALAVAVLPRRSRLDERGAGANGGNPLPYGPGDELGAMVRADMARWSAPEKWSSLRYGFGAVRRTRNGQEDLQARGDRGEAAAGGRVGDARSAGAEAVRSISVTPFTYYRWRREYGGLKSDQVKRLKELEKENERLRKVVSDLTLEKLILREAASGNF